MKFYTRFTKTAAAAFGLFLALGLCACGFHVGNSKDNDDYKNIFTDRAAELGSPYKASELAYVFSLKKYGSMMVYVDTTEGHSFELIPDDAEFIIKDAKGDTVIHAYFMDAEAYAVMTAKSEEIRKVNGRDFVYCKDQSFHHMFSYMADCGIDLGMVLESDVDESVFRLVAFRGDALEGASSDVYAYKGNAADYENDPNFDFGASELSDDFASEADDASDDFKEDTDDSSGDADEAKSATGSAGSLVNSTLSEDAEKKLKNLDTDYKKVNWGARYSAGEDMPYVVISVAPYTFYGQYYLLVGVTNLYDKDISFSAKAEAKGDGDKLLGDAYVYASSIGPGNTVLSDICCADEMPDGRLHWSDCEISFDASADFVPWEADYKMSGNPEDEVVTMDYRIYGADEKATTPGCVSFLLLDEGGNIMAKEQDFIGEELAGGSAYKGKMKIYGEAELLKRVTGAAMFAESSN